MFVKITDKSIYSTVFILILVLIILIVGYVFINKKEKKYEFLGNLLPKEEIMEESCNYTCGQKCNTIILPENFKFDTPESIRDRIEDFFNIYLDIVDVGCINDKIKRYIDPSLTLGKIFKEKNISIVDLNPNIFKTLDNIYFSNNPQINETQLNKYGVFKMIKQRLENMKLNNNNYEMYYDNNYNMFMINKNIRQESILEKIKPKMEEIVEKFYKNGVEIGEMRQFVDRNQITHTGDCNGEVCKIGIKNLIGQDMIKKLNTKVGKGWDKVEALRDDLSTNISVLKLILEISIITDLMLKYYDITNLSDIENLLRIKGIQGRYNSLRALLTSTLGNVNLRGEFKEEFKRIIDDD